ncbi:hypothetical protein LOK49_LG01G02671 [Camellia lanceoleosa]|uniref:Uncharacterized protein n=1 Tax=Camellia lanceoleosa TaxID=1840588 RepID=A0ACC0J356_9ERIC|nr:hypothetical protein LOK49_LG01G02671 [Camellia lanceoleosa]
MDGMQVSTHEPVPQAEPYYFPCMDGTQESMYVLAQGSLMQMVDNIRSASLSHLGMVNNITSQSSNITSKFVDFNIDDLWILRFDYVQMFMVGSHVTGEDKYYIFRKGAYKVGPKGMLDWVPNSCQMQVEGKGNL